jgi:nucleoid DNA-binding protein
MHDYWLGEIYLVLKKNEMSIHCLTTANSELGANLRHNKQIELENFGEWTVQLQG